MISVTPAIKRLKIRNLGPIKKVDVKFTKGINIIYGLNASGKTTAVNAIDHMVKGEELIYGPTNLFGKMVKTEIKVELLTKTLHMETNIPMIITKSGHNTPSFKIGYGNELKNPDRSIEEETIFKISRAIMSLCEGQAIILDDVFDQLSEKSKKKLLNMLRKSRAQAIITTKQNVLVKDANIISLEHKNDLGGLTEMCYEGLQEDV